MDQVALAILLDGCCHITPALEKGQEDGEDDALVASLQRWHDRDYPDPDWPK